MVYNTLNVVVSRYELLMYLSTTITGSVGIQVEVCVDN